MRENGDWQGTAFVLWLASALGLTFLLRHPAGQVLLADAGALWLDVALLPVWLGWALGWPKGIRSVGLLLASLPAVFFGALHLEAVWAVGLQVGLLLLFAAGHFARGGHLRLPRVAFPAAAPRFSSRDRGGSAPLEPAPKAGAGAAGHWSDGASWEQAALASQPPIAAAAVPVEEDVGLAGVEVLPAAASAAPLPLEAGPTDRAVQIAATALQVLERNDVVAPALHLESEPAGGSVFLDLDIGDPRHGKKIARARYLFEATMGARPDESLSGQVLRLGFPSYAHGSGHINSSPVFWVPLGRTGQGRRFLANLLHTGPLLVAGEDHKTLLETAHTILAATLGGALGRPPQVLLVEESGRHLDLYAGLPNVSLSTGPEALAPVVDRICGEQTPPGPPALALVLFPSPDMQERLVGSALCGVGPQRGIYPILVADMSSPWATVKLLASVRARLVFRLGREYSRPFLGRGGAEALGPYQAAYYLPEKGGEPLVLQTYEIDESTVQSILFR